MFNLIIIILFIIVSTIFMILGYFFNQDLYIPGYILFGLSFVCLFFSLVNNLNEYNDQLRSFPKIRNAIKKLEIRKNMRDNLLKDFKSYLYEMYPNFEKDIFDKISKDDTDIKILLKYPELKSSTVLKKLINEINTHNNNVYNLQKDILGEITTAQQMKLNKWYLYIPDVPSDISNISENL